jgi:hypothetical protein
MRHEDLPKAAGHRRKKTQARLLAFFGFLNIA